MSGLTRCSLIMIVHGLLGLFLMFLQGFTRPESQVFFSSSKDSRPRVHPSNH
ncbi:uncharacterized protein BDW43DRAFT_279943 [Aspergillus alliaceus]|uniref:uncharacterized protein n=1 Tax=Petromyces alliaceus TaxID=209559 RepID=UPI0012A6700D|nr:uncharacterized protein BDW43DRAFT_279943 [Aspergillus alliaceus]KAB8232290.1 hypothetical protein BDW43DRAFT_279943 [Aspergillus alliaceus]